ncbi:MAG: carboxylating nicotinate-nucleotide diphosphorylase [Armatimonadota bacterium]
MHDLPRDEIHEIVSRALAEDVGPGDVTTAATVAPEAQCRAEIVAKAEGVIAGLEVARATFEAVDANVAFEAMVADGARVKQGAVVARVEGSTRAVLTAERTALNFLQRMSGIATLTAQYVEAVKDTKARILDTRKTAPGLRLLDKYAVRMGGGENHRVGLFDGVLIKDNHVRAAGGVGEAVRRARALAHHLLKVEVEVQTLDEVAEAIAAGADMILLDNMDLDGIRAAVARVAGRCPIEVSGGVTLESVRSLAETGVDYISVGKLTHSAPALDLSLEIADD